MLTVPRQRDILGLRPKAETWDHLPVRNDLKAEVRAEKDRDPKPKAQSLEPRGPQARAVMPRIAWFTPLPPVRSGISAYSAELLPLLGESGQYSIEVFVDLGPPWAPVPLPLSPGVGIPVFSAHDFLWKAARAPYDLVVYQLGNAACHDYMWPYLLRYPGLTVV